MATATIKARLTALEAAVKAHDDNLANVATKDDLAALSATVGTLSDGVAAIVAEIGTDDDADATSDGASADAASVQTANGNTTAPAMPSMSSGQSA